MLNSAEHEIQITDKYSWIIVLFLLKTYIVVHVRTREAVLANTQSLCFRAKNGK